MAIFFLALPIVVLVGGALVLTNVLMTDADATLERWGYARRLVSTGGPPYRAGEAVVWEPRSAPWSVRLAAAFLGLCGVATLGVLVPGGVLGMLVGFGGLAPLVLSGVVLGLLLLPAAHDLVKRTRLERVFAITQYAVVHHLGAVLTMALALPNNVERLEPTRFLYVASLATAALAVATLGLISRVRLQSAQLASEAIAAAGQVDAAVYAAVDPAADAGADPAAGARL